jgi:hypothetical protein
MLIVETIAKVRRAYFIHQKPIKAICREFGLSRRVVRKVIRSEATEFRYGAQPAAIAADWPVAGAARCVAAGECGEAGARAADPNPGF